MTAINIGEVFFVKIITSRPLYGCHVARARTLQAVRSGGPRSAHAYRARKTISLTPACSESLAASSAHAAWGANLSPAWLDVIWRYFSPYDLNPPNPLRDIIEHFVDFDAVRGSPNVQLFVSATNVLTGRLRSFPRDKISADAVMASAALPLVFQAVTVGGVPYWDGGYMDNPAVFRYFATPRLKMY
jgi:Patatin-like phospholipase